MLAANKPFLFILGCSFFRYAGSFALVFGNVNFFKDVYPDYYTSTFPTTNILINLLAGLPSALLGGVITDKYESRFPGIKGFLIAGGLFIGSLFVFVCYITAEAGTTVVD